MCFAFLGTPEIMTVLVIALLVFGPEKLPDIGRQVGKAYREFDRMRNELLHTLEFDQTPYGMDRDVTNTSCAVPEDTVTDSVPDEELEAPTAQTLALPHLQGASENEDTDPCLP